MRKSSKGSSYVLVGATAALMAISMAATGSDAQAASVADFYKGKTFSVMIGFHPGGGYDAYGRLVARHIGKHIPGKPTVIPRNFPGASSMRLANYLYNKAPKDGTMIGHIASITAFAPLFGEKKAKFETGKFTWIGNVDIGMNSCIAWHTSGFKSLDDLKNNDVIFGGTSPTSVPSQWARGLNALLGTRIKVIHGYPGTSGIMLALKRGEVQGGCGFSLSAIQARWPSEWKQGLFTVLVQTGITKAPEFGAAPNIFDLTKGIKGTKEVAELIYARGIFSRPFAAPPGIPAERKAALRTAFTATMNDAAFLKDAKKSRMPISSMTGAELDKALKIYLNFPKKIVLRARQALEIGRVVKVKLKKLKATITKLSRRKVQVKDGAGKKHTFKIHGRRSKVKIGGKKSKTKSLKVGMSCTFRYFGEKDLAKRISCE